MKKIIYVITKQYPTEGGIVEKIVECFDNMFDAKKEYKELVDMADFDEVYLFYEGTMTQIDVLPSN